MKFATRLEKALAGDQNNLEFIMRWISHSNWRVCLKELTQQKIETIRCESDREIIQNPKNANAFFLRALVFQYHDKNYNAAKKLYDCAAALNHELAKTRLAYLQVLKDCRDSSLESALRLCDTGIKIENAESIYVAGFIYEKKHAYQKAITFYQSAITKNHASAMFALANIYANGKGTDVDLDAAIKLYEQAITFNHTLAMSHRAELHFRLNNETANPVAGVKLLRKAVKDKYNRAHAVEVLKNLTAIINTEVVYHAAVALYQVDCSERLSQFIISHTYEFLLLLQKDEFLSVSQKASLLDFMTESLPKQQITPVDVESYKIICQCYIDAAERELNKKNNIEKALNLYAKVPVDVSLREINGQVFYKMGVTIYKRAISEQNSPIVAFELAKFYFEQGIAVNNKECENEYVSILRTILSQDYSLLSSYQVAYEEFKSKIPPQKLALDLFFGKHHLTDLNYWKQHPITSATEQNEKTIPSEIKYIYDLATNHDLNETEKTKKIISKFNRYYSFFSVMKAKVFDADEKVLQCILDVKNLAV